MIVWVRHRLPILFLMTKTVLPIGDLEGGCATAEVLEDGIDEFFAH